MFEFMMLVDENGFIVGGETYRVRDDNGDIIELPPNVVPPYDLQGVFYKPKWNFNLLKWEEADMERALEASKTDKMYAFRSQCDAAIYKGFECNGDTFSFDATDQQNFTMQLAFCLAFPEDNEIAWKTLNNGIKMYNREQFFSICQAGKNHFRENKGALWRIEAYVNSLTSLDELKLLTNFETAKELIK